MWLSDMSEGTLQSMVDKTGIKDVTVLNSFNYDAEFATPFEGLELEDSCDLYNERERNEGSLDANEPVRCKSKYETSPVSSYYWKNSEWQKNLIRELRLELVAVTGFYFRNR